MYDVSQDVDELLNDPIWEHEKSTCDSCETELFENDNAPQNETIVLQSDAHKPFKSLLTFCKRFYNVIAIIASLIVACYMLIVIFSGSLLPYIEKLDFKSPRDRFITVETKNANDMADLLASAYGKHYSRLSAESKGYDAQMHLLLSDLFMERVNSYLPEEKRTDLSWVDDIALNLNVDRDGYLLNWSFTSSLMDHSIISTNSVFDASTNTLSFQIPELSKEYLQINLNEYFANNGCYELPAIQTAADSYDQMIAALPSEQIVNQLLKKYFSLIINQVQNVQKSDFTFCAGGKQIACSRLTATITEKELIQIFILILQTAKSDELIMKTYEDLILCSSGGTDSIPLNLSDEIDACILDLIKAAENAKDDNNIQWIIYIDKNKNMIGRRIRISGMEHDYYTYTIFDGDELLYYYDLFGKIKVEGTGNRTERLLNMCFDVHYEQKYIARVAVEGFDVIRYSNGNYFAKTIIEPTSSFTKNLFGNEFDTKLKAILDIKTTRQSTDCSVSLYANDEFYIGLTMETFEHIGDEVNFPKNSFNLLDENDQNAWLDTVDFQKIVKNLESVDLPSEFSDMLKEHLFAE